VRFPDFLKTAVLLFAGSATALAAVAIAGARADDDVTLLYVALGWWTAAALAGIWIGRRSAATAGIARLMTTARSAPALPEVEPGRIILNRLWALALFTVVAGALAFLIPQVPAIGAGYALLVALAWRRQAAAVTAVEERDGVSFYVERTSPLGPTRLLRTPGLRKLGEGSPP
jgi:hypothetical protein